MKDKKARLKAQRVIVIIILAVAALVLLCTSFFIQEEESQHLVRIIGSGFLLGAVLYNLFKSEFGYKPTREEVEENIFGKNK
jgi:hypothetical protein